jgi:hypothetical protein
MATKQEIRDYFAKFGKEGGKTRARNMTPEQRSESARKAVEARWAKAEKKLDSTMKQLDSHLKDLVKKNPRKRAARKGNPSR